jgi:hypothetical protein
VFTVVAKTDDHSRFLRGVQETGRLVKSGQVMPVVFPGGSYALWSRMSPADEGFVLFLQALGQPGDWTVKALPMGPQAT